MAAGVTDRVWEMTDIVALMEDRERKHRAIVEESGLSTKGQALGFWILQNIPPALWFLKCIVALVQRRSYSYHPTQ